MSRYDRGVYEPSDEVRVFDGSEEDDDVEGSRLPLLIVLALLVLAMFGGVVWLAYTQGVARGRGETPVLTAAAGPEKVAPPQAGGSNVPYQGFKIYEQPAPPDDSADNTPAPPKQAAGSEAPKPAPAAQAPAPVEAKPAPAPIAAKPPEAKPAPVAMAPRPAASKPVTPPPAAKSAAASKPSSLTALIQQADNAPAAKVAPTPVAKTPPATPAGPATGAPRQLGQAVAAAPKPAAPAPAAPAAATGSYVLQIGAYKSQADANAAWAAYKAKHAALLSGYGPDVKQADLGEKGTWYRLRVAGFRDREVATALCERLKADGGACILAK